MDINIKTERLSAAKLFEPLWQITSAIEAVEDVQIKIENISKGSIKSRMRLIMNTLLAKEEVKAVLETTKEAVSKNLAGVSYIEAKNSLTDNEKTKAETTSILENVKRLPTEAESKIQIAQALEKQALENEKQKIENAKAKLDLLEKLSDLTTRGVLQPDMIRIDINEITFILRENGNTEIGPPIGEITGGEE